MEKIEDVIDEALALPCLQRRLQLGKTRNAFLVLDHDLAVDQRRLRGQLGDGGGDVRKFFGPIETLAGEQTDLAVVEPSLDAITVELDLVHPAVCRSAPSSARWRAKVARNPAAARRAAAPCPCAPLPLPVVFFDCRRTTAATCTSLRSFVALACRGATWPLVAPALTLSCTLLLECQTRLRPLPSAISEIERPLTTDSGSSSRMSGSFGAAGFLVL